MRKQTLWNASTVFLLQADLAICVYVAIHSAILEDVAVLIVGLLVVGLFQFIFGWQGPNQFSDMPKRDWNTSQILFILRMDEDRKKIKFYLKLTKTNLFRVK